MGDEGPGQGVTRARPKGIAHHTIAREIGERILRGVYPPGAILPSEAAWSAEFGVSRSVVREAVKMLAAKGLLTSRTRVGGRVEPRANWNLLDRDMLGWYAGSSERMQLLRALQEFRGIFEPEAAALAALNRTEAQMERISRACDEMGTAPDLPSRAAADVRFHLAILEASGNVLLMPLGALIDHALSTLFVSLTREAGSLRHAQDLHVAIETAIRRRSPAAARKAVRALLENSDELVSRLDPG